MHWQRWLLLLVLLLGAAAPAQADPTIPVLTGRVVDLAHILDAATIQSLTQRLADEETSTSNQVVVVTLPSLQDYTIEQWGLALLNGWGIGQRGKDNGVVLVVAPNDRQLRIEVGYGLQGRLTNKRAAAIIENEIIPRFKGGDLKGGITAGVAAITETIAGTYKSPLIEASGPMGIGTMEGFERYLPMVGFPLLFIAIVAMNILFGRSPARRAGSYYRNRYDDDDDRWGRQQRDRSGWGNRGFSSGSSSGGFSGGGGSGGGGGASGRW